MIETRKSEQGLTLIELMIALALGLVILLVVTTIFINTSSAFRNLHRSSEQIENGRHALSILTDEIRHAGFYGRLQRFVQPAGAVNPCVVPTLEHLFEPVSVISAGLAATAVPPNCLNATEVRSGSDILVVRRVSTAVVPVGTVAALNVPYLQANPEDAEIQLGADVALGTTTKADGVTAATLLNRDGTAAPIRRLHVSIYYVSPCSEVTCGAGGGDGVPTLKRMELVTSGVVTTWATVPLVSGIEFMQFDLGVDNLPVAVSAISGMRGDGAADEFAQTLPVGSAWNEVVALRTHLLARTTEPVTGYDDAGRSYTLGAAGSVAGSGAFKRRVYTAEIRLNNVAGRRERLVGE